MLQKGLGLLDPFVRSVWRAETFDEHKASDLLGTACREQDGDASAHRVTDQVDRFVLFCEPGIKIGDVVPEVVKSPFRHVFRFTVPPVVWGLYPAVQPDCDLSPGGGLIEEPMKNHSQPAVFLSPLADMKLESVLPDRKHMLRQWRDHGSKR